MFQTTEKTEYVPTKASKVKMSRYQEVMQYAEELYKFTKSNAEASIGAYEKAVEAFASSVSVAREVKLWSFWSAVINMLAGSLFLIGILLNK